MKKSLSFLFVLLSATIFAQCPGGQSELEIIITPDNWPNENSWEVTNAIGEVVASGEAEDAIVCLTADECFVFTLYDTYGDGIFAPGGYALLLNGDSLASGNSFGSLVNHLINCVEGDICANAEVIESGTHTTGQNSQWYTYTPTYTEVYQISACGSGCNSAVWVYESCNLDFDFSDLNTLAHNSDSCNGAGSLIMSMMSNQTYYIRIGSPDGSCGPITWNLEPLEGYDLCDQYPELVNITVDIVPDNWPQETSWTLTNGDGDEIASGGGQGTTVCVDVDECIIFNIYDTYGDGIFNPGGYWLYYDGELVGSGSTFGFGTYEHVGCPPGVSCNSAEDIGEGVHTTEWGSHWYTFTPETTGNYQITTCGLNQCDTRIQVYDYCNMDNFDDTQVAAIYFNDNNEECGEQAFVIAGMQEGATYYIRISEVDDSCEGSVGWAIQYNGVVEGCTDPAACNFNPLAEIENDSCMYPGNPDCPDGPDLVIDEAYLQSTIQVSSITVGEADCYINEGCLNGYGARELIRFGTRIDNIGNLDFHIGNAATTPQMFTYDNCHNHNHVDGYAEYLLYELDGTEIPIGFKFGFCVMDLTCDMGGTAQYGCSTMGISAQCSDIYSSGLACQWVDVTGVPDGTYTLVVRTNWEGAADGLGNHELDYNNNWGQACLNIDRSDGSMQVELVDECAPLVDCAGDIYGNSQPDCTGACNGSTLRGDLDNNNLQDMVDSHLYVDQIIGNDIDATPCNDLNQDGEINVTDAALMSICDIFNVAHQHPDSAGLHTHCNFPMPDLTNPYDTVIFNMTNLNITESYFDIMVRNRNNQIVGFQLEVSGVDITNVEMLYDADIYPITPRFLYGGQTIIGLSHTDSTINKNMNPVALCRVYFSNPENEICLANIVDVVNEDYENTLTYIEKNCVYLTGISEVHNPFNATFAPNPMSEYSVLEFSNAAADMELTIMDLSGRQIRTHRIVGTQRFTMPRGELASGAYLYRLSDGKAESVGRLVVQ